MRNWLLSSIIFIVCGLFLASSLSGSQYLAPSYVYQDPATGLLFMKAPSSGAAPGIRLTNTAGELLFQCTDVGTTCSVSRTINGSTICPTGWHIWGVQTCLAQSTIAAATAVTGSCTSLDIANWATGVTATNGITYMVQLTFTEGTVAGSGQGSLKFYTDSGCTAAPEGDHAKGFGATVAAYTAGTSGTAVVGLTTTPVKYDGIGAPAAYAKLTTSFTGCTNCAITASVYPSQFEKAQ